MWHSSWTGGDWILTAAAMLVFWTFVVTGALAVRATGRRTAPAPTSPILPGPAGASNAHARAILDERLARGDLTPEEYHLRSELLSRS